MTVTLVTDIDIDSLADGVITGNIDHSHNMDACQGMDTVIGVGTTLHGSVAVVQHIIIIDHYIRMSSRVFV